MITLLKLVEVIYLTYKWTLIAIIWLAETIAILVARARFPESRVAAINILPLKDEPEQPERKGKQSTEAQYDRWLAEEKRIRERDEEEEPF